MSLFVYRLTRRGVEITSEVVCEKHHAKAGEMGPLSDQEKARGYEQTLRPYTGTRPCETCEEERERPHKGTAA